MNTRLPYLFALALALPLASCRFVGAKPDFTVVGDALSQPEADHVYVESKPGKSTKVASAPFAAPTMPAPAPAAPIIPQPQAAPTPQQPSSLFSQRQLSQPVSQMQELFNRPAHKALAQPAGGITYTVRAGDSLTRIARSYGVPVGSLAAANGIDLNKPLIKPGQRLLIPRGSAAIAPPPASTQAPRPTMASPAAQQPAPAAQPKAAPLPPLSLSPVAPPTSAAPQPARGQYRVSPGDTLYRIARMHGVSLQELMKANNILPENANRVRVGTLLTIPTKP